MSKSFKLRNIVLAFMVIVMAVMTFGYICNIPTAAAETKPSNFVTARTTGTLNGTLQKQPDGSVRFNGMEIASAKENLSQMYVILQGAGGAGGNRYINHNNCGGGSGAFALVLVKFKAQQNTNGSISYLPIKISSGYGGMMDTFPGTNLIREATDSIISIDNIGSISATAGLSSRSTNINPTPGGIVEVNPIAENMSEYMEVKYQQNG